jgi:hypothetical protein
MFMLAIGDKLAWVFLIPAFATQYQLITMFHDTLDNIININISVSGILLVLISVYSYMRVRMIVRLRST